MKHLMRTLVVICAIQALPLMAQSPAWMDPAWLYQNPVTVSNPNGSSLSQFQVHVTLGSGFDFTKAQSNGADLRVTASDGMTQIPFWIETWNASGASASIWVQVPSIPPSGTVIYLYYGNGTATSVSNGSATFEFFDDFEAATAMQAGYYALGPPTTTLTTTQAWETNAPHNLSVIPFNSGGYSYWGYYGLSAGCSGVGLAWSNDLINWIKYTSNPLNNNGRWPYALYVNGTIYMLYEKDYCTDSYIVLATSTDGINFTDIKTIVQPQSGLRNQNPNLFYNPNDGLYYLYYYHGDDSSSFDIRARSASSITDLDTAAETVVLHSNSTVAAPNMLFANNTYYLLTEERDNNNSWIVVGRSSSSPISGFTLLPGNPVLGNNSACMFQYVFGNTLHNYYCRLTSTGWTQEHRSANMTNGPQQFGMFDQTKWAVSGGGTWSIVTDTQQDGTLGKVAEGQTTDRQVLYTPNYNGTDYILDTYVQQIAGNVSGLGVRSSGDNNLYSINLYNGTNGQLYVYSWINNFSDAANATLASIGVGPINSYTWYRLMAKVHSNTIDLYLNGALQGQATDSNLTSGGVALYGEAGTTAEFNNVLVRKYAAADPTTTVGGISQLETVSSLTLTPSMGAGGAGFQGTVTLAAAAPAGGVTVSLSSDNAAATVPSIVTVPAGATSATFSVTTSTVTAVTTADISAAYGNGDQTATLTLNPYLTSVGISPSSVVGGNPSQGIANLFTGAPVGGALITLGSDNSVATVPPSVTVPQSATSATFGISTTNVTTVNQATISASYAGITRSVTLTVTPESISVSVSPTAVPAGSPSQGTVVLGSPAPSPGGAVVTLASDNSAAGVPANVTVPAGSTSANFTVSTSPVNNNTQAHISATYGGTSASTLLTVQSNLTAVTLSATLVTAGTPVTGTVVLPFAAPAGGAAVSLSSNNAAAVVPASVTVPQNATSATFSISTTSVSAVSQATISASYAGTTQNVTLTVTPGSISVSVSPTAVAAGSPSQGTVVLGGPAPSPGGAVVTLASDNLAASVPSNITVPAGSTLANFAVTTSPVNNNTQVHISATYAGTSANTLLTVQSNLTALTLSATPVSAGTSVTGTVVLLFAAPVSGAVVSLTSDNAAAAVPPSVTVPGGSSSASFSITTTSVSTSTTANIAANYLGSSQAAALTIVPAVPVGFGWLGSGWLYRSLVTINNPGATQLNNYQVHIVLDSTFDFTKTAAGGADVRFTSSDGSTQIPFWIESWNSSTFSATIWVNVPSIASGGTSIYMYYGNAAAATASNGSTTFDFFDDFLGGTIDPTKWTASAGTWTVVSDIEPNGAVGSVARGSTDSREVLYSSYSGTDYVVDAYGQQMSGRVWGLGVRASSVSNLYSINLYDDLGSGTNLYVYSWVNNPSLTATATLGATSVGLVNLQTWYRFSIRVHSTAIDVYKDGALVLSVNDSALSSGGVALYGETNNTAEWSNIIVRKYAATEPTTSVGPATTPAGQPGSISISVNPNSAAAGSPSQGTVTVGNPAPSPGGAVVTLASDNSAASVPANVTVPAGSTSASFTVSTSPVNSDTQAHISATYSGVSASTLLTVQTNLAALTLSETLVAAGTSVSGTTALPFAAPTGGAVVSLSSDNAAAVAPTSVTVPGGSSSASFSINTTSVSTSTTAHLTASYLGSSQAASLTIVPLGSGWIGGGWLYRSLVTINNPGAVQLTNYQVRVVLDSTFDFTKTAAGGADVRFTSSDGSTPIPFWIESWNSSTLAATIWVNVPSVASNGTNIYMYYGNAAATTASNGSTTFDFFDDFSGGTIDPTKWAASEGTPWTVVSDTKPNGTVGNVARGSTILRKVLYSSYRGTDYVLDAYGQQISGRVWGLGVRATGVDNLYSINLYDDLGTGTNLYIYSWVNDPSSTATATLGSTSVGAVNVQTWYRFSIRVHSSTIDIYKDGTLVLSVSDSALGSGGVALYGEENTVAEWSNIIVREYTATEPTTSVGSATTH